MTKHEKLKALIDEIDILIQKNVTANSPDFQAWKFNTERFLIRQFGNPSLEYAHFKNIPFALKVYPSNTPYSRFVEQCKFGLETTRKVLSTYLQELEEDWLPTSSTKTQVLKPLSNFTKVFVVHGHDTGLRDAVARMLERQGIEAIILQEQVNAGATIIEKFEVNSNVDAAICLFTADDVGGLATSEKRDKRARQNVVFEAGFFIGKLGRSRVIIIADSNIEIPSDLDGVISTKLSNWKTSVLQELKHIGYNIDFNKEFC